MFRQGLVQSSYLRPAEFHSVIPAVDNTAPHLTTCSTYKHTVPQTPHTLIQAVNTSPNQNVR